MQGIALREEAERLRIKAFGFDAEDPFRQRYLDMAGEYEQIVALLEKQRRSEKAKKA
jgi:hypothetical protein